MNERIIWIDWCRSFCMFLVVLGHCHINESESYILSFIYSFHMPFFFFLSGFLCNRSLSYYSLNKDLRYLVLPYFTFGLMAIMWEIISSSQFDSDFIKSLLKSFLIGDKIIGPFWFFMALFICKQLFLIIKLLKNKYITLYYVIIALTFYPIFFISNSSNNIPFFIDSALLGLPFFCIGNETKPLLMKFISLSITTRIIIMPIFLIMGILFFNNNGAVDFSECIIKGTIFRFYNSALSTIISIILLCSFIKRTNKFIITESYGTVVILGTHKILLNIFNYYLPVLIGKHPGSYPSYIAFLYSIFIFILCYYAIHMLDKYCANLFGLKGQLTKVLSKEISSNKINR